MAIRPRTIEDLDALALVASRVHAEDNYPIWVPGGDIRLFLERPAPVLAWVAEEDSNVVGHVALNESTSHPAMELVDRDDPSRPPIYIARLLVDPGSRRRGLGRQLLDHARQAALDAGRAPYLDVVDVPTARPAIKLYRTHGWTTIGRVRFDLGGNELEQLVFRGPHR